MSNRTIEQNLTLLSSTKRDIRNAINIKGGSVSSATPFADYATAISNLPSGGGGGEDLDWSLIGYSARPSSIDDAYAYARQIYVDWDATQTNLNDKFSGDTQLVYMPLVDTSNATSMIRIFKQCSGLTSIPQFNTSACTNMSYMFNYCNALTSIPLLDTSNVTNFQGMFDKSRVSTIPQLNTSAATNMSEMFVECKNLTSIPLLDTSNVTNMGSMFRGCSGLTSIPQFDTSKVTGMNQMFSSCKSLTTIPQLNTSACTNMSNMFDSCTSLGKIEGLDFTSVTNIQNMVGYSDNTSIRYALFKNLGTPSGMTYYQLQMMTNWGVADSTYTDARDSLVDSLLTYSFDRATAGYSTCTIKLHSNSKNQLTAQEISDIEAKGYTITT